MYKKILVPMALNHDLSPAMLDFARGICADGGTVMALHVIEEPFGTASAKLREDLQNAGLEHARELFAQKLAAFPDIQSHLVEGHVGRTIIAFAEAHGVDCIVMGSHEPGLADYLIGSTAARVVRHATCSVHVYRG